MFATAIQTSSILLPALCGTVCAVAARSFAGRFASSAATAPEELPALTLLKPLYGDEPALEQNLESFFCQDYPGRYELVFGVQNANDPAIDAVERLRVRHPQVHTKLVIDERRFGSNPKVANLINMSSEVRHGIIILSDSDIAVPPDYLSRIVASLEQDDVGAVSCVYTGWAAAGFGSRLSAMGISYHFLPNVVTGVSLGLAAPCFGSTIAVKRSVLDQIGGFGAFADQLADDYEIGRAVRERGYRVALLPFAVRHACSEETLADWLNHELRWMRTIRTVDPAGHAGSIVTHVIPLALAAAVLSGFSMLSAAVLAMSIAARALLKWRIDAVFGGNAGPFWLLPLRDVLSFGVFLVSLFGASVVWQNERLRVSENGALSNQ